MAGDSGLRRDCEPCYLGITLGPRLNLHKHLINISYHDMKNKARSRIDLLKLLAGSGWGATLHSLRTMYEMYVWPALEYVSPVLTLVIKSTLRRLNLVHNAALSFILVGLRSTPNPILERAAAVEPLGLKMDAQCVLARERFLGIPTTPSEQCQKTQGETSASEKSHP